MSNNQDNHALAFMRDFLLGGISGAISKTCGAPLERVKLLLQTQDGNEALKGKKFTGFFNCMSRCVQEEGFLSLWRGNWANVVRYFPTTALNFGFKDFYAKLFPKYSPEDKVRFLLSSIAAGGSAGASSMLFVYPLDFARTRLGVDIGKTTSERKFTGLGNCISTIFRQDGIQGLYQGFGISVFSIFVYRGLYFGTYDAGKSILFKDYSNQSFWVKILFAQFVTNVSEIISYPFDTVRRRQMMNAGRIDVQRDNALACARKIYFDEGFTGFFKGNLSNMMRSVTSSMVLVLYDEFQKQLNVAMAKKK
jgi:solute carrier family 25 (mitochondrial adenine nucleotide translocator), member 4/5/6/31